MVAVRGCDQAGEFDKITKCQCFLESVSGKRNCRWVSAPTCIRSQCECSKISGKHLGSLQGRFQQMLVRPRSQDVAAGSRDRLRIERSAKIKWFLNCCFEKHAH